MCAHTTTTITTHAGVNQHCAQANEYSISDGLDEFYKGATFKSSFSCDKQREVIVYAPISSEGLADDGGGGAVPAF